MYCKYCGQEIRNEAKFCRYCGKPVLHRAQGTGVQGAGTGPSDRVYRAHTAINAGRQQKLRSYTLLRLILAAVCIALIIIGIRTIPGNIKALKNGTYTQAGAGIGKRSDESGSGSENKGSADGSSRMTYEEFEALTEEEAREENGGNAQQPVNTGHPSYTWYDADPDGWGTEEEGAEG